jgi:hypothetical protein
MIKNKIKKRAALIIRTLKSIIMWQPTNDQKNELVGSSLLHQEKFLIHYMHYYLEMLHLFQKNLCFKMENIEKPDGFGNQNIKISILEEA